MSNNKYKNEIVRLTQMLESTFQQVQYYKKKQAERDAETHLLINEIQHLKKDNQKLRKYKNSTVSQPVKDEKAKDYMVPKNQNELSNGINKTKSYVQKIAQLFNSLMNEIHSLKKNSGSFEECIATIGLAEKTFSKFSSGLIKHQQQILKNSVSKELLKLQMDKLRKENTSLFELIAELQENFTESDKITKEYMVELKRLKHERQRLEQENEELGMQLNQKEEQSFKMTDDVHESQLKYRNLFLNRKTSDGNNEENATKIQQLYEEIRRLNDKLAKNQQKQRIMKQKEKREIYQQKLSSNKGEEFYGRIKELEERQNDLKQQILKLQEKIQISEAQKDRIITVYQNQSYETKDRIIRYEDKIIELEKMIKLSRNKQEQIKEQNIFLTEQLQLTQKKLHEKEEGSQLRLSAYLNDTDDNIKLNEELKDKVKYLEDAIRSQAHEFSKKLDHLQREKEKLLNQYQICFEQKQALKQKYSDEASQLHILQSQAKAKDNLINQYDNKVKFISKQLNQILETWAIDDVEHIVSLVKEKNERQVRLIEELMNYRDKVVHKDKDSDNFIGNQMKLLSIELQNHKFKEIQLIQQLNELLKISYLDMELQATSDEKWLKIISKIETNTNSIRKERQQMQAIQSAWEDKQKRLLEQVEDLQKNKEKIEQELMEKIRIIGEDEKACSEHERKIKEIDDANKILIEKITEIKGQFTAREKECEQQSVEIRKLEKQIKRKDKIFNEIKTELQDKTDTNLNLMKKIEGLEEDQSVLKQEIVDLNEKACHHYVCEEEYKDLKEDLFLLRSDLDHKNAQLSQQKLIQSSLDEQIKRLTQLYSQSQKIASNQQQKVKRLYQFLGSLRTKIHSIKRNWTQFKASVQVEKTNLEKSVVKYSKKTNELLAQYEQLINKNHQKFIMREKLSKISSNVTHQQIESENALLNNRLKQKNQYIQQLNKQAQLQHEKQRKFEDKIKQLEEDISRMNKEIQEKTKLKQGVQDKLKYANKLNSQLLQKLNEAVKKHKELQTKQDREKGEEMKKKLHQKDDEIKRKNDKIQALKEEMLDRIKECVELQDLIKEKQIQISEMKDTINNKEKAEHVIKQYYQQQLTKKDFLNLEDHHELSTHQLESLSQKINHQSSTLEEYKKTLKGKEAIIEKQKQTISRLITQNAQISKELKLKIEQLEQKEQRIKNDFNISQEICIKVEGQNALENQIRSREIEDVYLKMGDEGHMDSIRPYKDKKHEDLGKFEMKEKREGNLKQEQLLKELKITEQYKEIIEAENKNLKKEISRKDKICTKYRQMEKVVGKYKKELDQIQTELKLKDISLMKNEKELKIKVEEVVKLSRALDSLKEELNLEKKRTNNFEQLYEKYRMKKNKIPQ